jgi:hypothetical protein
MKNFAVLNGNKVQNIIVCESEELATEITGLTCIDVTDNIDASIEKYFINNNFLTQEEYDVFLEEKRILDREHNESLKPIN